MPEPETTPPATPCSVPECNTDGSGEPCDRHEAEHAHAEGEHAFCGLECEVTMPSEQLRNAILCRAIPGSKNMLAELERRAAADRHQPAPASPVPGLRDQIAGAARHAADSAYGNTPFIEAITDAVLAIVQPVIDEARAEVDILRRGAAERADLLEEARDALSAAGQNGAHGDDWPNIAPAIRALGERAEALEAALDRVREQCAEWLAPTNSRSWDAQVRDSIALGCAHMILAALTPPVPADQPEGGAG